MGKITIDEMHNSLFDYAQAVSDENLMTENKTIVDAINEIYGKRLIADSIGEPLNNTDTFTKMSNDINNLLSTFKTNIMNAGIAVESGDKFKALIDKIQGLTEGEGNKGIQFVEGVINTVSESTKTFTATKIIGSNAGTEDLYYNTIELDFEPYILFTETIVESYYLESLKDTFVINNFYNSFSDELTISHIAQYQESLYKAYYNLEREENVYYNPIINALTAGVNDYVVKETKYYAIGLGEKDNTICDDDKGLRFAEGVCDNITIGVNTATNWHEYIFEQDFGFIPSRIMFQSESTKLFALNRDTRIVIDSHYHYSEDKCWYMTAYNSAQGLDNYRMYISNISSTGFSLFIKSDSSCFFNSNTWYAIGVGEEDTTLRDSLASILEDEGVSVTEEDDMASLITKVDEEFDNKNITDFSMGTQKLTWTVYSNEWIELSLNHSCGKIPKLVSIGFFDYKTELSNKYHTDENNYAVHKPTGLTNIYHFYISSITNDTIFLKMRHSNFNSGSSTHGVTAHYVLVY